jgi:GTP-binding protein
MAPKKLLTLEECMEYIEFDECIEVTPNFIRMRKIILDEVLRKNSNKQNAMAAVSE